jgi:VIT1/CCC1 family predicted Fe2+/Mn2+ transporter
MISARINKGSMFLTENKNRLEGRFRYWLSDDLTAPLGMRISDQVQSSRRRRQNGCFMGISYFVCAALLLSRFLFITAEYAEIAEKLI